MGRKDITLSEAEVQQLLEATKTLQVATIGSDGWPHLAPMWFVLDDRGRVRFRTFTKSQKLVNLIRNPRLTLLAETGTEYGELRGVMIKGTAKLIADRETVLEIYGEVARKYRLLGDLGNDLEVTTEVVEATLGRHADKNTAVVVEPHSVVSWDHSKLGGSY